MNKKHWAIGLLLCGSLATGFALGILADQRAISGKARSGITQTRKGNYRFINPLLECDGAADAIGDRELRPFHDKVEALVRRIEKYGGAVHVSVYFRDLNNGPWFGIDPEVRFSPASLLKVPIMMAYLKRSETEPDLLTRRLRFASGGRTANAVPEGAPKGLSPGRSYAVEDLIHRMIVQSDNAAMELLARSIEQRDLDAIYTDLVGPLPPQGDTEDFLTVKDYASFFRILYNGSYLSRDMSERALSMLSQVTFHDGLAAGLPEGTVLAHKYGDRTFPYSPIMQLHDCGIIYHPGSPYLLCVMSRGSDFSQLAAAIGEVSRMVYDEVRKHDFAHQ